MMAEMQQGDVRDFSNFVAAVIDKKAFTRIKGYLDDAKANAKVLGGGGCDDAKGWFVEPTLIQTKDGDIISGLVLKENARAVTIATSDHPEAPVEVLKSKIQERAKSTTSMMPENLLDAYTPQQIAGLVALLLAGPGGTK